VFTSIGTLVVPAGITIMSSKPARHRDGWRPGVCADNALQVYGVPPEQVIGSSIATDYEVKDGKPLLMRLPKLFFVDDGKGKAIGINLFIGKRPYAAFGNSNGDREMLEWTGAGDGVLLKMLVLHDDGKREFAYGPADGLPDTKVGTFPDSLMKEAKAKGWTIISMKRDWKRILAFE
jgi:hypothetical protein